MTQREKLLFKVAVTGDMTPLMGFKYKSKDLNILNSDAKTPLFCAVESQNIGIVKEYLSMGANPNENCVNGNTPLHIAFKHKNIMISGMLIAYGAKHVRFNNDQKRPSDFADAEMLKKINLRTGDVDLGTGKKVKFR